uniref:Integrase, catalytic region, zinc finger, CCHC-type, peptidase aspartic, catalytic n=1 Tax=Tanacetum cinerariifolium TaxID=118510 RepID=A0A6L2JDM6_TANCI|nr:hypothetical protein [Tanacetum cinerariifolium]
MELYMMNRQHGQMILESIENGPLIWPTIEDNGVTRPRKYSELTHAEAIQAHCDVKATNIILQGLPLEVYALISNHRIAKELWERIQFFMQGTSLTKQVLGLKVILMLLELLLFILIRYTRSHYPKIYWESLPEDVLGVITQRRTGVITRRHIGSHYLKTYWESLPEEVLGVITRRRTGSHYPKTYWESLPEDVLSCI